MTKPRIPRKLICLADRIFSRIQRHWEAAVGPLRLNQPGVNLLGSVRLRGIPIVIVKEDSSITLGDEVTLTSRSISTDLGVSRPCILRTLRPDAQIVIGSKSGLSGCVICAASSVMIGNECLIGADVMIFDTDFHALEPAGRRTNRDPDQIATAPVVIEKNVFIGARSVVCKGVTIGANSVIGAGSIVTKDIPANTIAAGNPCRVIRPLKG